MNKKPYSLVHEDDSHYEVMHDDGSHLKIAKKSLSEHVKKNISSYFGGGLVESENYADGGDVEEPGDAEPTEQPPTQVEGEQPAAQVQGIPTAAAPQEGPKPGSILEESVPEFAEAFKEQKVGAAQEAAAEGNLGQDVAADLSKQAKSLQQIQQDSDVQQLQRQQDSEEFKDALRKGDIDPDRLYKNKSVPQKILTGIGLVLGGIGAFGTGGHNLVAEMLQKKVQEDVEAQKADVANKRSLYSLNLQQAGDEREASALTERQLLDHTQTEVQKQIALSKDPQAQARLQSLYGQIDMQKAGIDNSLRLFNWQKQMATTPFRKEALGVATPDQQKRAVILPDGQTAALATDEKSAGEARTAINTVKPVLDTLGQIEKIRSSLIPIGDKAEQVRSLIPTAMLQLKQAQKIGRLSPEVVDLLQKQFSNPTELVDAIRGPQKTKTLKNSLMNQLYTQLQSSVPAFNNPNAVPTSPANYGR